jgi:DNA-binding LytR/AlgR family response regulator
MIGEIGTPFPGWNFVTWSIRSKVSSRDARRVTSFFPNSNVQGTGLIGSDITPTPSKSFNQGLKMHAAIKPANIAKVSSALNDLHAARGPHGPEPRAAWAQGETSAEGNLGCCATCGQTLTEKYKFRDASPAGAQALGIEVLSRRAGWQRRLLLKWDDIQLVSCDAKYINVHDKDGLVHLIENSLDSVCKHAGPHLVRVHRGHAINPKHLSSLVSRTDGSCDFVMQSGVSVPGSRRLVRPARITIFGETMRRRSTDR